MSMQKTIESLSDAFIKLVKHPDKTDELKDVIRDILNEEFHDITCRHVFISNTNGTNPFNCIVIPHKPDSDLLKTKFVYRYDIDIDLSCLINNKKSLDPMEMTAWLLHELTANIITDETLLRFKKLIIKYYDEENKSVMNSIDLYGNILWIGIFDRTKKFYSSERNEVNTILDQWGIIDHWDSALTKFVANHGGSSDILSDEYLIRMDKIQVRQFNKIARKYSSYALKYNDTEYSTMSKYLISATKSKLLEYYISKEPEHVAINAEKNVFKLFDDTKVLYESTNEIDSDKYNSAELLNRLNKLKVDINSIECMSDKLAFTVQVKDLANKINEYLSKDSSNNFLQNLRYDVDSLIDKLRTDVNIDNSISVMELE